MNTPQIPPLFSLIPSDLFRPLTGTYAPLYWAILARFYQLEFEREPFFIVKQVSVQTAEEALQNSSFWRERRDELLASVAPETGEALPPSYDVDEASLVRETARRLVSRLERAGWIQFEYRKEKGEVLNFPPYAARLLETLTRIARDEQPVFQGYAHTIASLLRPDTFAPRPGASLTEAKRHALDLIRELKILNQNIHVFIQRVLDEVSTASGVLEEGLDHYQEVVMGNYHRLKTIDNLYKWRGDILLRLDTISRDALSLDAAGRWYAEQYRLDIQTAR